MAIGCVVWPDLLTINNDPPIMKTNYLFIVLSATALAVPSQAALTVTDGGFELGGNAQADTSFATSVANWSESTPGDFRNLCITTAGSFPVAIPKWPWIVPAVIFTKILGHVLWERIWCPLLLMHSREMVVLTGHLEMFSLRFFPVCLQP